MERLTSKAWLLGTLAIAVTGIVVSNFVGASGSASGSGSSVASKVTFMIGALSALLFIALLVSAGLRRRRAQ